MSIASSKTADSSKDSRWLSVRVNQAGEVDLDTPQPPLAIYLRNHAEWVERCFVPLKVYPLSDCQYELQFFRMGGLGFELEPRFAVEIGSDGDRLFFLHSIEATDTTELPYTVDCRSQFRLEEREGALDVITRVYWTLHLDISIQLPGFLMALPRKRVQSVAEAVANQVARRMCERLTRNICDDYAQTHCQGVLT